MNNKKLIELIALILILSTLISYLGFSTFQYNGAIKERELIPRLLKLGYVFETPAQYFNETTHQNKTALIIHDIDFSSSGLQSFVDIERYFGVKSAFYPRWTLLSFSLDKQLAYIQSLGWEVGFQYECLSASNGNYTEAYQTLDSQFKAMVHDWHIETTDYHGDTKHLNINNYLLFNETLWKTYGLNEVYSLNFSYITDTNAVYREPDTLGALVVIQLHTDWSK